MSRQSMLEKVPRTLLLDIGIVAMVALMTRGGDAVDLFHVAFLLLVVEAFILSPPGFWLRLLALISAVEFIILGDEPAWQDVAEPMVLALIALLVFVMHRSRDRAREELQEQATHDHLTGLLNRRALQRHLDDAIRRLHRDKVPFAVAYIDMDGFKAVNDAYGHDAGDTVLRDAAARIKAVIRDGDVLGRIGGDEFAILLSGPTDQAFAELVAQRVLAELAAPFDVGSGHPSLSASIGIAMASPARQPTPHELLADADRAMFSVKHSERGSYAVAATA